jgi:WD repeat-containing protein 6
MPASDPVIVPSKHSLMPEARHTVLCIKRLHQSSIKSCNVMKISQGTFMVATGGDDNALGLSLIRFQDSDCYSSSAIAIESLLIPHAHSAAIGAISIIPNAHGNQGSEEQPECSLRVITCGNDQRLKLWSVQLPSLSAGIEDLEVYKVANEPTAVADIADLAILENNEVSGLSTKVLICGIGMEIWTVTHEHQTLQRTAS